MTYVQDNKARTFAVKGVKADSAFEDVFAPLSGTTFVASAASDALFAQLADVTDSSMLNKLAIKFAVGD